MHPQHFDAATAVYSNSLYGHVTGYDAAASSSSAINKFHHHHHHQHPTGYMSPDTADASSSLSCYSNYIGAPNLQSLQGYGGMRTDPPGYSDPTATSLFHPGFVPNFGSPTPPPPPPLPSSTSSPSSSSFFYNKSIGNGIRAPAADLVSGELYSNSALYSLTPKTPEESFLGKSQDALNDACVSPNNNYNNNSSSNSSSSNRSNDSSNVDNSKNNNNNDSITNINNQNGVTTDTSTCHHLNTHLGGTPTTPSTTTMLDHQLHNDHHPHHHQHQLHTLTPFHNYQHQQHQLHNHSSSPPPPHHLNQHHHHQLPHHLQLPSLYNGENIHHSHTESPSKLSNNISFFDNTTTSHNHHHHQQQQQHHHNESDLKINSSNIKIEALASPDPTSNKTNRTKLQPCSGIINNTTSTTTANNNSTTIEPADPTKSLQDHHCISSTTSSSSSSPPPLSSSTPIQHHVTTHHNQIDENAQDTTTEKNSGKFSDVTTCGETTSNDNNNNTSTSATPIKKDVDSDGKPTMSYIALIAKAILESDQRRLNLGSIYGWIERHYPFYKTKGQGWRNSVRHNLSLNDCFIKAGRCEDGKGNYWAIHPANIQDFIRGDFRQRRRSRRRGRKKECDLGMYHVTNGYLQPGSTPLASQMALNSATLSSIYSPYTEAERRAYRLDEALLRQSMNNPFVKWYPHGVPSPATATGSPTCSPAGMYPSPTTGSMQWPPAQGYPHHDPSTQTSMYPAPSLNTAFSRQYPSAPVL